MQKSGVNMGVNTGVNTGGCKYSGVNINQVTYQVEICIIVLREIYYAGNFDWKNVQAFQGKYVQSCRICKTFRNYGRYGRV